MMNLITYITLLSLFSIINGYLGQQDIRQFELGKNVFLKDGKPYRILSGSIHYFRIVPDQWLITLILAKLAGLNTVETYIPWSLHQPEFEKPVNFEGILNISQFLDIAKTLDLNVLIRIGPFNDAGLDYGGLPTWLISKDIPIRQYNSEYLHFVTQWVKIVSKIITPYLYENGGNILMIQVENEYGLVGCNQKYIDALYKIFRKIFPLSLLYTTDPCFENLLKCGNGDKKTPLFATVDFGANFNIKSCVNLLKSYQPDLPMMNSEYYTGWFTKYGDHFGYVNTTKFKNHLSYILKYNFSVNFYMFRGGSNFAFLGGTIALRQKLITSFDYHAPLNEHGEPTEIYKIIQHLLRRDKNYVTQPKLNAHVINSKSYGKFNISNVIVTASVFPNITSNEVSFNRSDEFLEHHNFLYGFTLFNANLPKYVGEVTLKVSDIFDEVVVIYNQSYLARSDNDGKINIFLKQELSGKNISFLHFNYGHLAASAILEHKSLGIVLVNSKPLSKWTVSHIDMLKLTELVPEQVNYNSSNPINIKLQHLHLNHTPVIINIDFDLNTTIRDTYLYLGACFQTGYAIVNGQNVGYYNNILPPQRTLYIPSSFLQNGKNKIIAFEYYYLTVTENINFCQIELREDPVFIRNELDLTANANNLN